MKRIVNAFDYAGHICKAMGKGILLTTKRADQINTMTIGWGTMGIEWGKPVFVAYVRDSRFTRELLDDTMEFTVNIPMDAADKRIVSLCGTASGRNVDKFRELGLHTQASDIVGVPGIQEFPLTLECKVIYRNVQDETRLPESVQQRYYSAINAKDFHIAYYGEIVNAYIIED